MKWNRDNYSTLGVLLLIAAYASRPVLGGRAHHITTDAVHHGLWDSARTADKQVGASQRVLDVNSESNTAAVHANRLLDFRLDFGGRPDDPVPSTCRYNTKLLSQVLQHNASGNTLLFNDTFHFFHGVEASHVNDLVLQVDGVIRFERDESEPSPHWRPAPCFFIHRSNNITLTSSNPDRGLIDGRGSKYWGVPGIGFLELQELRPRMVEFNLTNDLLIENIIFQDSPYHTIYLESVQNVEVRNISIIARRTHADGHSLIDLSAFNTDGIDVSGSNVHVHDVDIWTQDDCIAVKDTWLLPPYQSTNMLFERVNCSGLGFVIGSVAGTMVRNITFRDSYLYKAVKGIYLKFRSLEPFWTQMNRTGLTDGVTFENIVMEEPLQWPIWVGPAQQSDHRRPCQGNPCSLCWPQVPMAKCNAVPDTVIQNLLLKNVTINNPHMSPGVLLGGSERDGNLLENITFDSVRVTKGPPVPAAREDRILSFPCLKQPIVDHYVPNHQFWLENKGIETVDPDATMERNGDRWKIFGVIFAVVFASLVVCWHAHSPRVDKQMALCLAASLIFFAVYQFYFDSSLPWSKPWNRTDQYFRCLGIVNGVAKSDTWPVPSCFDHITTTRI